MLSSKLIATIAIISIAVSVSSAADTVGNKQRTLLKTRKGRRNNIKVENVMNEEDVVFFTRTLQGGSLPPSGGGGTAPGTMEPVPDTMEPVPATPLPTDMVRIFDIAFQLHILCVVDAYSYYYIHAQYTYNTDHPGTHSSRQSTAHSSRQSIAHTSNSARFWVQRKFFLII